jgi:hypothetical protein
MVFKSIQWTGSSKTKNDFRFSKRVGWFCFVGRLFGFTTLLNLIIILLFPKFVTQLRRLSFASDDWAGCTQQGGFEGISVAHQSTASLVYYLLSISRAGNYNRARQSEQRTESIIMDLDRDPSMSASSYNNGFAAFSPVAQQQQQQFLSQHLPQQQQQLGQPLFGLIAASAAVRTDFSPVEGSNDTKFTLSVTTNPGDFPSPLTSIHELVFFLLPGASSVLPLNSGLLVYWQVEVVSSGNQQQQSGFELLGSLVPSERRSDVFRTGWSEREEFIGLDRQQPPPAVRVNFGISIEPIEVVRNLTNASSGNSGSNNNNSVGTNNPMGASPSAAADKRPLVAQKIAKDLYNFMLSFDTGGARGNQTMTVPANIFDRWWKRFEAKLKRDPNFFLKNDD